jgi:hypothetical protein
MVQFLYTDAAIYRESSKNIFLLYSKQQLCTKYSNIEKSLEGTMKEVQ